MQKATIRATYKDPALAQAFGINLMTGVVWYWNQQPDDLVYDRNSIRLVPKFSMRFQAPDDRTARDAAEDFRDWWGQQDFVTQSPGLDFDEFTVDTEHSAG